MEMRALVQPGDAVTASYSPMPLIFRDKMAAAGQIQIATAGYFCTK